MRKKMDIIQEIKERVVEMSGNEPDILAVYLLGSIQNGNSRPDSDIDLGIMLEPGRKMSSLRRIELANKLSYELGRTVDMGEVSSRNLVYTREALLKGHLLFQKDFNKTNLYHIKALYISDHLSLFIEFHFLK